MAKQIKISFLLLGLAVFFSVLHNMVYALFGVEEPVFFSLTLLLFLAFVVSIPYNIFVCIRRKKTKKKPKKNQEKEKVKERLRNLGYW